MTGRAAAALLLLASVLPAGAVGPDEILPDKVLEGRARALSAELRCLVCQNQSIDESDAPLARDLRILVRERLRAGDSDGAIRDFVVGRYGDFVLLRPPFDGRTLLLWLGPALLLAAGAAGLVLTRRKRVAEPGTEALTEGEEAHLQALLGLPTRDAPATRPPRSGAA